MRAKELVDFLKHFSGQELEKMNICLSKPTDGRKNNESR